MVMSYSSTFEYFSSSFFHLCISEEKKKKKFEKPSLMTIELSLVVKNIPITPPIVAGKTKTIGRANENS